MLIGYARVSTLEQDLNEDPATGLGAQKRLADTQALNAQLQTASRPDVLEQQAREQAAKVQLAAAPATALESHAHDFVCPTGAVPERAGSWPR